MGLEANVLFAGESLENMTARELVPPLMSLQSLLEEADYEISHKAENLERGEIVEDSDGILYVYRLCTAEL